MKTGLIYISTIIISLISIIGSCDKKIAQKIPKAGNNNDSFLYTKHTTSTQDTITADTIRYYFFTLTKDTLKNIKKHFTSSQLQIILAINRIDFEKLYRLDSLIVPDTFIYDLKAYSPFPYKLPILDSVKQILLFSYRIQAFGAYENGNLVRWGPTSMGKESTPTPTGLFHTNWRFPEKISTFDTTWIMKWYFNFENFEGISIHEYELPGYPASHACIRLLSNDAIWVYNWANQWKLNKGGITIKAYGTPMIIFGSYDFKNKKGPWNKLPADPTTLNLKADSLAKEIIPHLPLILKRQAERDSVLHPSLLP